MKYFLMLLLLLPLSLYSMDGKDQLELQRRIGSVEANFLSVCASVSAIQGKFLLIAQLNDEVRKDLYYISEELNKHEFFENELSSENHLKKPKKKRKKSIDSTNSTFSKKVQKKRRSATLGSKSGSLSFSLGSTSSKKAKGQRKIVNAEDIFEKSSSDYNSNLSTVDIVASPKGKNL